MPSLLAVTPFPNRAAFGERQQPPALVLGLPHADAHVELAPDAIEEREAPLLSPALRQAIDATNAACVADASPSANDPPREADAIAHKVVTE